MLELHLYTLANGRGCDYLSRGVRAVELSGPRLHAAENRTLWLCVRTQGAPPVLHCYKCIWYFVFTIEKPFVRPVSNAAFAQTLATCSYTLKNGPVCSIHYQSEIRAAPYNRTLPH